MEKADKKQFTTIAIETEVKEVLDNLEIFQSGFPIRTANDKIRFLLYSMGMINERGQPTRK